MESFFFIIFERIVCKKAFQTNYFYYKSLIITMKTEIVYPKEKYLWKYLDLYKFLSLVQSKQLYFSCLNDFDDVMELAPKSLSYYIGINKRIADVRPESRNNNIPSHEYDNKQFHILDALEGLRRVREKLFCSSFYSAEGESKAMWNIYSGIDGIALKFKSSLLIDYIYNYYNQHLKDDYLISSDYVKYESIIEARAYDDDGNIILDKSIPGPFVKDNSYSHENEYRIILESKSESKRPIVNIDDFKNLKFEIYVNADIDDWKVDVINGLIKDVLPETTVKKSKFVTKSLIEKYQKNYLRKILDKTGYYKIPD